MNINDRSNLIYRISNLKEEQLKEIDLTFYLVRKQKEADDLYQSIEDTLAEDVNHWLKAHIIKALNDMKQNDLGKEDTFHVGDYNHEIERKDQIARYNIGLSSSLLSKKNKLIKSFNNLDGEFSDRQINFQLVKLTYNKENAYFCFYRGVKKNTSKKKFALRNSNQLRFIEETIIDIGGNIDFFFVEDFIFISNVTSFENAFDYRDHINELRDNNLSQIISMPFFDDERSNKELFEKKCKTFIFSRSLAQISPKTLSALQTEFESRCDELSVIKRNEPRDEKEKIIYREKFSTLWGLFEYIDVASYKVVFNDDALPTPLIHFFSDKIVKSFLTKDFKLATSYE